MAYMQPEGAEHVTHMQPEDAEHVSAQISSGSGGEKGTLPGTSAPVGIEVPLNTANGTSRVFGEAWRRRNGWGGGG